MIQLINPCGGTGFCRKCYLKNTFFLQKWLFLAEFLSDDNIYAWVFLFDQVFIQVLSPIETHVEVDGLGYTPLSSLSSFV